MLPPEKLPRDAIQYDQPYDEEICHFYSNYKHWILDYAETFISGKGIKEFEDQSFVGDSGFDLVALLNGHFDLIGQLCSSDGTNMILINKGRVTSYAWKHCQLYRQHYRDYHAHLIDFFYP
ncbi:MAG: hypothetical protein K8L97_24995 [Anaerolineae bacterium]|nr:hypothetical protein [Anaerolineae bacterium]